MTAQPQKGICYTPKDTTNTSEPDFQRHFLVVYFGRTKSQKLQEIYCCTVMDKKLQKPHHMVTYTKLQVKHIQNMLEIEYDIHQVRISCLHMHLNYGHKMTENNDIHTVTNRYPRKYDSDNSLWQGNDASLWGK